MGMKQPAEDEVEQIYLAFYPRLVGELTVVTGSRDTAQDCAHEAFTRLVLHWTKVSNHNSPIAWLRTVGYRLAIGEIRRTGRLAPLSEHEPQPRLDHDQLRNREIWQAVLELPAHQREILVRRAVHDLSDAEIADDLTLPVGTVKSRLSRARTALRARLGEPS